MKDELQASIEARRELGAELEPHLVDGFVERIEKRLAERGPAVHYARTPLVLGSLGLAIPLIAIAGGTAGLGGVALVCLAIVLVNLLAYRR